MRRIQGRSVSGASVGVIFTVGSGCAFRSGRTGRVIFAGMSPGDVKRIRASPASFAPTMASSLPENSRFLSVL